MKAKCRKCGDTVEVTRSREYKSCKCGAISLDYGDEFYYRVVGNPEDFDGEIEDAPKVKDRTQTINLKDSPKAKVSDPDLETLSVYCEDISNHLGDLANDFGAISRILSERNERYAKD